MGHQINVIWMKTVTAETVLFAEGGKVVPEQGWDRGL